LKGEGVTKQFQRHIFQQEISVPTKHLKVGCHHEPFHYHYHLGEISGSQGGKYEDVPSVLLRRVVW
jgi:hypothetical protein